MAKDLKSMLDAMWADYIKLNPAAKKIHDSFVKKGETVLNDHIALRTFKSSKIGVDQLAKPFEKLGYKYNGDYHFKEKKLYAKHYEHPNSENPKIFISELLTDQFSKELQDEVKKMLEHVEASDVSDADFFVSGRPWPMTHKVFEKLAAETEYAAWVGAHGFRPNHFTVNVNALKSFKDVQAVNEFLKTQGVKLNTAGGEVKGTPADYLEQSSTMASSIPVQFDDGTFEVPGCYYEFALRHKLPDGKLYQGFVAKSADKIFESTNRR